MGILSSVLGTLGNIASSWFTEKVINAELSGKEKEQNLFNAKEAALQREFAREERLGSQDYNAVQASLQRGFAREERLGAQDFNAAEAQKSRDFQQEMDSTKYQRAVADMQAAGVNPALAIGGVSAGSFGASASVSPASGAAASSSPASGASASGSATIHGLSSILEMMKLKKDMELLDAEKEKRKAETKSEEERALNLASQTRLNELQNEYQGKLYQLDLDKGEVEKLQLEKNLEYTDELIGKISAETNLIVHGDRPLKQAQAALAAAQKDLADKQGRLVDAQAFVAQWEKNFIDNYGLSPDLAGDLVRTIVGSASSLLSGSLIRGAVKKPNTTISREINVPAGKVIYHSSR